MKKIIRAVAVLLMMGSPLIAGQVHYLQDVQLDKKAKFGVSGTSNAILEFKNSNDLNKVVIQSTMTTSSYTLTLPIAAGANGEALTTAGNGQLYWTTVSTLTTNQVKDEIGYMVEGSTHNHITTDYDSVQKQLHLSVSTSVILDNKNAVLDQVTISSLTVNTNVTAASANITGTLTAGQVNSNGNVSVKKDAKFILDSDGGSDTYFIKEAATGNVRFFNDGVEYMRHEASE